MRALNILLSIAVSLAIALGVFEAGLRLVPAFRPQESINEFHPKLGWAKKPNARVGRNTGEFSITFETNADGLRDEASVKKPGDTFRVMCLGDSFVLGYTVDREDLFVDLLEERWRSEGRQVEVINAGTEGYSTDQQVLWFEEYGKQYEPDVVLLFPYENDIYWCGAERYTRYPKPRYRTDGTLETGMLDDPGPTSAMQNWAFGRMFSIVGGLLTGRGFPEDQLYVPRGYDQKIHREFAPLFHDEPEFLTDALARTKGALLALQRSCKSIGARLIMAPIPSEAVVHESEREKLAAGRLRGAPDKLWSPDKPVERFLIMARELGIEAIDAREPLKRQGAEEELYFAKEWHFNPAGNRVFAALLDEELNRVGVFPDSYPDFSESMAPTERTAEKQESGLPTWALVYLGLFALLGITYTRTYPEENAPLALLKVGGLLAVIFAIWMGGIALVGSLPPAVAPWVILSFVALVLGFVAYKLGDRITTILELFKAFTLRGHWYLMPLVVVLLTIGSLLVVAASSPFIAPFIYTLF